MRSTCRAMPDRADSTGYGTRIRSERFLPVGGDSPAEASANCQVPLRFCQRERVSCGRGYSGRAFAGETSWVHGVVSDACAFTRGSVGVVLDDAVSAGTTREVNSARVTAAAAGPRGRTGRDDRGAYTRDSNLPVMGPPGPSMSASAAIAIPASTIGTPETKLAAEHGGARDGYGYLLGARDEQDCTDNRSVPWHWSRHGAGIRGAG